MKEWSKSLMMNKSYSDSVSIVSTGPPVRTQWRYLGSDLGSGSASVSAKDYVTLERYKRNLGRPFRSTRANATAISCVILTTLLFFVGALFLALYLIKPTGRYTYFRTNTNMPKYVRVAVFVATANCFFGLNYIITRKTRVGTKS